MLEMTDADRVTWPHFCLQWGNVLQVGYSNLKRRGIRSMHPLYSSPPLTCLGSLPALHGDNSELMERLGEAKVKTAPDCSGSEATGASATGRPESITLSDQQRPPEST